MAKHSCETCGFRAKYDSKPHSFLGRLWHWHASWCPGWKKFILSQTPDEKARLADQYDLEKFK